MAGQNLAASTSQSTVGYQFKIRFVFLRGCSGENLGPHACKANALPADLSVSPVPRNESFQLENSMKVSSQTESLPALSIHLSFFLSSLFLYYLYIHPGMKLQRCNFSKRETMKRKNFSFLTDTGKAAVSHCGVAHSDCQLGSFPFADFHLLG